MKGMFKMKKLLISVLLAVLSIASPSFAQTVKKDLIELHMSPEVASYLAGILPAGSVLGNNTFLKARNQANGADIEVLKVDATDDTQLNADSGDVIKYSVAKTPFAQESASQKIYNISGSSYSFITNDADGSDDSYFSFNGGGAAADTSRGSFAILEGNEAGGRVQIGAGNVSGGIITFDTTNTTQARITRDGDIQMVNAGDGLKYPAATVLTPMANPTPAGGGTIASITNIVAAAAPTVSYLALPAATANVGKTYWIVNQSAASAQNIMAVNSGETLNAVAQWTPYVCAGANQCACTAFSSTGWGCK